MNEMLENVAKAICRVRANKYSVDDETEIVRNTCKYRPEALAAIAAMREPTRAMLDAGTAAASLYTTDTFKASLSFQAMIDEALKDRR